MWELDPQAVLLLALSAAGYAVGLRRLWRTRAGRQVVPAWRVPFYAAGLLAAAVALLSPVGALDDRSFALHMVEHVLLVAIALPCILLGAPLLPLLWALPLAWRRRVGVLFVEGSPAHRLFSRLTEARLAWLLHVAIFWVWHAPPLYDAAVVSGWVHSLQHLSFVGSGLLFWWPVVHPAPTRRRLSYAWALAYLFAASLQSSALGMLITYAPAPWYPAYTVETNPLALSALEDQRFAGLVMWVGGGLTYLLAILGVLGGMAVADERATAAERRQRARGRPGGAAPAPGPGGEHPLAGGASGGAG